MTLPPCLRPSRVRAWALVTLALLGCEADTSSGPAVVSVSVVPDSVVLHSIGETVHLEARVDGPADVVGGLVWGTNAREVATVSSFGVVTAVGPGVAVVTAELDGEIGTAIVRVEQAPAAVRLTPSSIEFDAIGATQLLTATVVDAGGHAVPGARARWSTVDPAVVRVDSTGVAIAVAAGMAEIRAEAGGVSATAAVVVRPAVVTVALVAPPSVISVGDQVSLVTRVADRNGNPVAGAVFAWSSSDVGVLSVDGAGRARGLSLGRAQVIVRSGAAQASADIDVVQTVVTVDAEGPALLTALGDSVPLRAVARDASGRFVAGAGIMWTSLDPGIASISPGGFVRAVANGTARVVAASGPAADTVPVRVLQTVTSVVITPGLVVLPAIGATAQLTATAYDARGNPVLGRATTWSSSFPPTVGVSSQGLVTVGSEGGAYITAAIDGVEATIVVRTGYKIQSVTVSPDSLVFRSVQISAQLVGVVRDSAGAAIPVDLSWGTSNGNVAYITGPGRVYALSPGTATITASVDTFSVRIPVRVAPKVGSVDLMNDTIVRHRPGIGAKVAYLVSDTAGRALRPFQLDWTSRDPAVFRVDSDGWITTVGPGRAWVVGSYGVIRDSTLIHVIPYSQLRLDLEFDSSRVARLRTSYRDTLVATVRDLAGTPVQGVRVLFATNLENTVTFSPVAGSRYFGTAGGMSFGVWTDKDGHAPTRVFPRDLAGDWLVSASIDVDSTAPLLADTMTFTVVHGPPARIFLSGPPAITVGQSGQVTGTTAADLYGNRFPATPTFSTSSPFFSVTQSGAVTALGVGSGYIRGEYSADGATVRDSVVVNAVPSASLGATQRNSIPGSSGGHDVPWSTVPYMPNWKP